VPSQVVPSEGKSASSSGAQNETKLLSKVSVLMGVSAYFKGKQFSLEDVLHKIISSQNGVDTSFIHAVRKYSEICETLIDGLVDASDFPGFVRIAFVRKRPLVLRLFIFRPFNPASERSICLPLHTRLFYLEAMLLPYLPT
jgi:hypothetical protein